MKTGLWLRRMLHYPGSPVESFREIIVCTESESLRAYYVAVPQILIAVSTVQRPAHSRGLKGPEAVVSGGESSSCSSCVCPTQSVIRLYAAFRNKEAWVAFEYRVLSEGLDSDFMPHFARRSRDHSLTRLSPLSGPLKSHGMRFEPITTLPPSVVDESHGLYWYFCMSPSNDDAGRY